MRSQKDIKTTSGFRIAGQTTRQCLLTFVKFKYGYLLHSLQTIKGIAWERDICGDSSFLNGNAGELKDFSVEKS